MSTPGKYQVANVHWLFRCARWQQASWGNFVYLSKVWKRFQLKGECCMRMWLWHKFLQILFLKKRFNILFSKDLVVTLHLVLYSLQDCINSPIELGQLCTAFIKTIKRLCTEMIFVGLNCFYTVQWQQHKYFPSWNLLNHPTLKAIGNNKCE